MTALTIAGFDPSSGAGATADLLTFAAHGIFGTSALTALTVQSTLGVQHVQAVEGALLADTLACLQADLPPAGVKVGMLGGAPQARAVAAFVRKLAAYVPVVIDPVLLSSSGAELLTSEGLTVMMDELLPRATVVTPNAAELSQLTGMRCETQREIRAAAGYLAGKYPRLAVVCTGGDRTKPDDYLLHQCVWTVLEGERIETRATHGTGCAFSSALLCGLLRGQGIAVAAREAKAYVAEAMRSATPLGGGKGPMNLMWPRNSMVERLVAPVRPE